MLCLIVNVAKAETGYISWYSQHSQPVASKIKLDANTLTAAHRKYPFGTRLLVINTQTHQSIVVTINDRGPYAKHRILDLSKPAAEKLGLITHCPKPNCEPGVTIATIKELK